MTGLVLLGEIGLLSPSPSSPSFSNVGEGSSSFDWLGHSLASFESESQGTLLVVGAPGSHECGREGCFNSPGKAVIMDAERGKKKKIIVRSHPIYNSLSSGSVLAELHGREDLEKFGQAVEVGRAEVGGEVREVIVVRREECIKLSKHIAIQAHDDRLAPPSAPHLLRVMSTLEQFTFLIWYFFNKSITALCTPFFPFQIEALEDEDDAEPISVIEGELKHGRLD